MDNLAFLSCKKSILKNLNHDVIKYKENVLFSFGIF